MSMNKLSTIGNLTRDPELKTIGDANCVNFTVASDSRTKGADGKYITNFYSCTAWRQAADTIARYMHKGDKIAISGDLTIRPYKDQNGADRTAVSLTVTDFEFLSTRRADANTSAPAQQTTQRPPAAPFAVDESLPF